MGEPDIADLIQAIQDLSPVPGKLLSVVDWLAASACTSAGTGHDLHKVVGNFSFSECFHQFSGIAQSAGNRHLENGACQIEFCLLPAIHTPDCPKCVRFRILLVTR